MFCFRCKKYIDYEEVTLEKSVCPIEEKLALCNITGDEKDFPNEIDFDLKQNKISSKLEWRCKEFMKGGKRDEQI